MRLRLSEPRLFVIKTVSVFALAFALVPLLAMKQELSAQLYAGSLVVLHVFVLGVYFYRVRFRELDPDARSLIARVLALVVVVYLLSAVSAFDQEAPLTTLALQMLGISILHMAVLLLLMVRVERGGEGEAEREAVGAASTADTPSR